MYPEKVLTVRPGFPLRGELPLSGPASLPGDKSISHRALVLAALAQGSSRIENLLVAGVTEVLLESLRRLGVPLTLQGRTVEINGLGLHPAAGLSGEPAAPVLLECGNSATTMRLLAGLLSAWGMAAILDGSPGLRSRPMDRILEPLERMGMLVESASGHAPLTLRPSRRLLQPLNYQLPVASAQVKSCLALAALAAEGVTTLVEPAQSRDHTERMLLRQGVQVEREVSDTAGKQLYTMRLHPPLTQPLKPIQMEIPGDFSAAAFLIVAAAVTPGSEICLSGVGLNPTRIGLLEALAEMRADIEVSDLVEQYGEPAGTVRVRFSQLRGITIAGDRVVRMIDEFPAFAVAAACAQGVTTVREAGELRHKESDRIGSLAQELSSLGVAIQETADGFQVQGGRGLQAGAVSSHGDHRLALALAVAGLAGAGEVSVRSAEVISESFPGFIHSLQALGANVELSPGAQVVEKSAG